MDAGGLYEQAVESWLDRVRAIGAGDWERRTPCWEWTVRDLVAHVTDEDRWTVVLLRGGHPEDSAGLIGGDQPSGSLATDAETAAASARAVVAEELPSRETVHLSYGPETAEEYVRQLAADHLVHAWDLAVATGGDTVLPGEAVREVGAWFAERAAAYRAAGLVAAPVAAGSAAGTFDGSQASLLGLFGRRPAWGPDDAALSAFAAAFGAGDVDAIMALMTDDCVFESTSPAPDGQRLEGAAAVRQAWETLFTTTRSPRFTTEDLYVSEGRGTLRWRFDWTESDGSPGHVRGIDAVTLRGGKISEKLSYVKG